MKLYEALATRKSLETQLTQLISIRSRSLEYPEDEQPEFDFDSLTVQIKDIVRKLSKIKVEIARVNLNTQLSNGLTLTENIIELGNLRSTITQLKDMLRTERRGGLLSIERRSKEDVKMARQKDQQTLLSMLHEYSNRRDALDSLIQQANTSIDVTIS